MHHICMMWSLSQKRPWVRIEQPTCLTFKGTKLVSHGPKTIHTLYIYGPFFCVELMVLDHAQFRGVFLGSALCEQRKTHQLLQIGVRRCTDERKLSWVSIPASAARTPTCTCKMHLDCHTRKWGLMVPRIGSRGHTCMY